MSVRTLGMADSAQELRTLRMSAPDALRGVASWDVDTLGTLLKQRRKALKHNQSQAGKVMGVAGTTVSRWETGTSIPEDDQVDALVEYLGLPEAKVVRAMHRQVDAEQAERQILSELRAARDEMAELRALVLRAIEERAPRA